MKPAVVFSLVIVLVFASFLAVSAQPPEPNHLRPQGNLTPMNADAAQIAVGQPGVVYRYVRTWGDPQMPYFSDQAHLNEPTGLTTDGANVWIAEEAGRRLMKYSASGTFLMQIGEAGLRHAVPAAVQGFTDVAVDASGNIWATDWAHHVLQFDSNGAYVKQLFGDASSGQGNNQFNTPFGLAFDSAGRLYVSDTYNHRIQVLQADGTYLATIGVTGQAGDDNLHFNEPRHITIDDNSRLYVADSGNHRIQILDLAGFPTVNHIATIGDSGVSGADDEHLNTPSGVAVDISRGRIFVSDGYNQRVQVFNYATRAWLATVPAGSYIGDIAVDSAGTFYVAIPCCDQHIVKQFNASLNFVRHFGAAGVPYLTDALHYYQPSGVAVAADGSLYISEARGRRLTKLGPSRTAQWSVGVPGAWGGNAGHFSYARAIDVDSHDRVYVADEENCRVQIYDPDGSYYATLGAGSGNCGQDNDQFNNPRGVAIGSGDMIYVADSENHRIQVFDNNRNYVATIGQTGVAGDDNAHFNWPIDVDVDASGNIYVVDHYNHRVQVFSPSRVYVRTVGAAGDDLGQLRNPTAVVVGAGGRTFVTTSWGDGIHVFDGAGAYLTTIGGSYGALTGQLRDASGLALDAAGNLYVADSENHRVQEFAPGVPKWRQLNINGFGDQQASWINSMLPFQGSLYAAGHPAQVWRMTAAGVWSQANSDGFGDVTNFEIDALAEFNNHLYATTWTWSCDDPSCSTGHTNGLQIWRTPNGTTWQNVTPAGGIAGGNRHAASLVVFKGYLYAALSYGNTGDGAEIWRTPDGLNWTQVAGYGFDNDIYTTNVLSMVVYNDTLYAGTRHGDWHTDNHADGPLGGEVWRSDDGTTWTRANAPGFGDLEAYRVDALIEFRKALYAYVSHVDGSAAGADVWRCTKTVCAAQADWTKVANNGFGIPQNQYLHAGAVLGSYLYAAARNDITGVQIWRTIDGAQWQKALSDDGLGNSNNGYVDNDAMTVFDGRLTLGATNWINGSGVWQQTLVADFTAAPTRGAPPLLVQFTSSSPGGQTSLWDFGDGATSTAANPTHTYTMPGRYTVSLTVGDGIASDTMTRKQHIEIRYMVYLPMTAQDWDAQP